MDAPDGAEKLAKTKEFIKMINEQMAAGQVGKASA